MIILNKIPPLIFVLLLISFSGIAQEEQIEVRDLETWSSIGIKYKIDEKWSLRLDEQLRLKNNSSQVDEYFTELELKRKFSKHLAFVLGLRYIRENDDEGNVQGYEDHFRLHLDVSYKYKINRFAVEHRIRYQNKNELGVSESEGDYPDRYLRFKTSLGYKIKNWPLDPEVSAEIFRHNQEGDENNGFNKYRLTIGTDYKIKKVGKIGVYYRMQKQLNVTYPKVTNIIGAKFTYNLN